MRAEAAYFLFQIYYFHEKNFNKSVEYITWLRIQYPNNSSVPCVARPYDGAVGAMDPREGDF